MSNQALTARARDVDIMTRSSPTLDLEPGIKLSVLIPPAPTDDDLQFVRQLGVHHVYTWVEDDQRDYEYLATLRQQVEAAGLTLFNAGNISLGKSANIHLALPDRDRDIDQFARLIRNLGRAGIFTTTFTWEPDQVWSTQNEPTRGGAAARAVDMAVLDKRPPTHGRTFSTDEIWDNFTYFIRRIIPVAEEVGVRLALHPNDPPVPAVAGVPCLIHSFADYERAFEIGDSDYLGMEFCTGCWLEGGDQFGNMLEAIRYFARRGKIFIAHFRNVSAPLPHFVETFVDGGYMDMPLAMKAFIEADYRGTMILDHTPRFTPAAGPAAATAYAIGYMKALLERAKTPA